MFSSSALLLICLSITLVSGQQGEYSSAKTESMLKESVIVKCKAGTEWYSIKTTAESNPVIASKISNALEEVIKTAGFLPDIVKAKQADIGNSSFCASSDGNYYFFYEPEWFAKLNKYSAANEDWMIRFIVADVISHINLAHHLKYLGSTPENELKANEYAGELLARMGATLEQTLTALRSPLMKSNGSYTHPSTEERLKATEKGWIKGRNAIKQRNKK